MNIQDMNTMGWFVTAIFWLWFAAGATIEVFFEGACNDRPDLD